MKKRGREEWRNLVKEQKQSGMSISAWCRARGIKESTYTYWRQQYQNDQASGQFVRIDQGEPVTVICGRCRIEVRRGFDKDALKRVLEVAKDAAM